MKKIVITALTISSFIFIMYNAASHQTVGLGPVQKSVFIEDSNKGKQQFEAFSAMRHSDVAGKQFSLLSSDGAYLSIKIDDVTEEFYLFGSDESAGSWSISNGYLRLEFDSLNISKTKLIHIALVNGSITDGEVVVIGQKHDQGVKDLRFSKSGKAKKYTGDKLSLNFQDIEVRSVVSSLFDLNGKSVVIDPDISGSITIQLRDMPWDAALDIITKSNNLEAVNNNGIHVVASKEKIDPYYSTSKYENEPLSLNFQDIEVRSILQFILDSQHKNVAISNDVSGTLSLSLGDVPSDQALDIVLMLAGLEKVNTEHGMIIKKKINQPCLGKL